MLRMAGGILAAKFVDPSTLGLFNGIGLVQSYLGLLQMGIINGLGRELPYFIGKNNIRRAHTLTAVAQFWIMIVGGVCFVVLMGVAVWHLIIAELSLAAGWSVYAASVFFMFYTDRFLVTTFKTNREFNQLAMADVLQSLGNLISVVFVYFFHFYGLCIRLLVITLVKFSFLWKRCPVVVKSLWSKPHWIHLFKIGAPNLAVGQATLLWSTINSTLVFGILGKEGLGLYTLTLLTSGVLLLIPTSLNQILYPRLSQHLGEGKSVQQLLKFIVKPAAVITLVLIPVVAVAWFALPPLTEWFLPKYVGGIKAAQWAMLEAIVLSTASINNIFVVVKQQHKYLIAAGVGFLVYLFCIKIVFAQDLMLESFSQSMLIGKVVFMLACYIFAFSLYRKKNTKSEVIE